MMLEFSRRSWSLFVALSLAACTDHGPTMPFDAGGDATTPSCPALPILPSTELTGAWQGMLTLQQTLSGKTEQADWPVRLPLGGNGYPVRSLSALGYLGDWQVYGAPCDLSLDLQRFFDAGGTGVAYSYYLYEADGPANTIQLHTTLLAPESARLRWSYEAAYHAADLLHYGLYAYTDPSALYVQVSATESYAVSGNTLSVQAVASGKDDKGQPYSISVTGTLTK